MGCGSLDQESFCGYRNSTMRTSLSRPFQERTLELMLERCVTIMRHHQRCGPGRPPHRICLSFSEQAERVSPYRRRIDLYPFYEAPQNGEHSYVASVLFGARMRVFQWRNTISDDIRNPVTPNVKLFSSRFQGLPRSHAAKGSTRHGTFLTVRMKLAAQFRNACMNATFFAPRKTVIFVTCP